MVVAEDILLKDLPIVENVGLNDLIPISQGTETKNISFEKFIEAGKLTYKFDIEADREIEIFGTEYGLYQLDDYSSGWVAIYIISHYETKIVSSIGPFGTNPDFAGLSLFKKTPNGPLFCRNRYGISHSIGFKRL